MSSAGDAPPSPAFRRARTGFPMSRTRGELLRGAVRAFAEHGVRRTAMQDIAAAAGVAKGTLYNHFRTKDDVARAVLAAEFGRLAERAHGRPPAEALSVLAEEVARHPVLRRLGESEPELLVRLLAAPSDAWATVVAGIAETVGLTAVDAELAGRWLLGLVLQPGSAPMRRRHAELLVRRADDQREFDGAPDEMPHLPGIPAESVP